MASNQDLPKRLWQAAFSPDGQRIVTASLDQTGRVWSLLTLQEVDAMLAR
jgi:WD40 repeat protein